MPKKDLSRQKKMDVRVDFTPMMLLLFSPNNSLRPEWQVISRQVRVPGQKVADEIHMKQGRY